MKMFVVMDYTNIVIGQVRAASMFLAWDYASKHLNNYYGIYISEVR